jgi:hypothetical protein
MRKKGSITAVLTASAFAAYSQIKDLQFADLTAKSKEAGTAVLDIVDIIIQVGLGIAFISVIYMVATKNQNAKEWVIGFFVAIILYLLFYQLIRL